MKLTVLATVGLASVGALALFATSDPAEAGRRSQGTVTECSRYGNGCLTVPVRQGRWGPEMRLKGGTWIDCRGNCKDTLREEVIDFWETIQERAGDRSN